MLNKIVHNISLLEYVRKYLHGANGTLPTHKEWLPSLYN